MTAALARLPRETRPAALLFEEPFGEYLPCEVGGWSALLRATMAKIADNVDWTMPATIDDPVILDEITRALQSIGYAK